MNGEMKLFAGTANPKLAEGVAKKLGVKLERTEVTRFSDGEIRVELRDNVRGCHAYVIQPTCAPANDTLMELALMADALKRSAAQKVIAVIPYYGYARQDRRPGFSRVPISARVTADILQSAGVDHVMVIDLHATQIQGFFHIPVDNLTASNLFVSDIYHKWRDENPIIVSPDVGGVARARHVAKLAQDIDLAIVDKRRPKANVSEVMNIIGDVTDRTCIIIDDMVDTAGTLAKAANALIERGGARRVIAYATHGVLSGAAVENLNNSLLEELIVTDSIPLRSEFETVNLIQISEDDREEATIVQSKSKVRQISCAHTLAEAINRIHTGRSISEIMDK